MTKAELFERFLAQKLRARLAQPRQLVTTIGKRRPGEPDGCMVVPPRPTQPPALGAVAAPDQEAR